MALPILWSMLPSIVSAGVSIATRPRRRDYMQDTSYIDKYIANLEGRRASREVEQMAMRPALRAIGTQAAQQRRQVEYESAKYGVRGSGIEAQQKLSVGQQAISAAQDVGERAGAMQIQEGRRIEDYIQQLTMQKGMMEERGRREFQQARRQSRAEIIGGVAQIGVAAGAGIAQNIAAKKAAGQVLSYQDLAVGVSSGEVGIEDIKQAYDAGQIGVEERGNLLEAVSSAQAQRQRDIDKVITKKAKTEQEATEVANIEWFHKAQNPELSGIMLSELMDKPVSTTQEATAKQTAITAQIREIEKYDKDAAIEARKVADEKAKTEVKAQVVAEKAETAQMKATARQKRIVGNITSQFGDVPDVKKELGDVREIISNPTIFMEQYEDGRLFVTLEKFRDNLPKAIAGNEVFYSKMLGMSLSEFTKMTDNDKKTRWFNAITKEMENLYKMYSGVDDLGVNPELDSFFQNQD